MYKNTYEIWSYQLDIWKISGIVSYIRPDKNHKNDTIPKKFQNKVQVKKIREFD